MSYSKKIDNYVMINKFKYEKLDNLFTFNIDISTKYFNTNLHEYRFLNIIKINSNIFVFKFICMNKYCKTNYDNSDGYVDIIIKFENNIEKIIIRYYYYLDNKLDKKKLPIKDGEVIDSIEFISNYESSQFFKQLFITFENYKKNNRYLKNRL